MRPIPKNAVDFVAAHEGLRTRAYHDSAGIPTIGYGRIDDVSMGDICTKAEALDWLAQDMQIAVRKLYSVVSADVLEEITDNQWAALLSFAFNLGFKKNWTIAARLNARQYDQVPVELAKFNRARVDGRLVTIEGLVNRRAEEQKLWSRGAPGSVRTAPPSIVTRAPGMTPPKPGDPTPATRSSTMITGFIGAAATVPVAAQQITAAVSPFADKSEIIEKAVAILATIAACAAVVALVLTWLKKLEARR